MALTNELRPMVLVRHPGVLIVTRLKVDADLMAEQINDLSREYGYLGDEDLVAMPITQTARLN